MFVFFNFSVVLPVVETVMDVVPAEACVSERKEIG